MSFGGLLAPVPAENFILKIISYLDTNSVNTLSVILGFLVPGKWRSTVLHCKVYVAFSLGVGKKIIWHEQIS